MADMHITRELLEAIARGEIPSRVLEEAMFEHLRRLCPHCKSELEAFAREREAARRGDIPQPGVTAFASLLDRHLQDLQQGHERARRDVEHLLTFPRDQRPARIKRSRTRYRGRLVAWVLLKESRTMVTLSPEEAEHLAQLAAIPQPRRPRLGGRWFSPLSWSGAFSHRPFWPFRGVGGPARS